ncbi:hypothetical protein [Lewinella sp. LCG006]|uniref:hypothetical protein n=1 Tax=Lewinella sp. LCG006 TaxID=3231911 RepID=UPI003460E935
MSKKQVNEHDISALGMPVHRGAVSFNVKVSSAAVHRVDAYILFSNCFGVLITDDFNAEAKVVILKSLASFWVVLFEKRF